ncbi:MAG TPA: lytic transglycosylase domain-containing protein [Nitrospira sp.]|nr:lytic transglycosylase domain-containing protein [Nitrospira sp.]
MIQMDQKLHAVEKPAKTLPNTASWLYRLQQQVLVCTAVVLVTASAPSVLVDLPAYQDAAMSGMMKLNSVPTGATFPGVRPTGRQIVSGVELEQAVIRAANEHQLHPALLLAVMKAESSFNPVVVSKAGAVGLMQLIPETAMRHGVRNLYDTDENVAGGAKHLRYLLDRFNGNMRLALAAYNAGERKVDRYRKIPPYKETRLYVQKVLSYYRDYRKAGSVTPHAQRHDEGYVLRAL